MKNLRFLMWMTFLFAGIVHMAAQGYTLKGVVEDTAGDPLIGASVVVEGKKAAGVATDIDGRFQLNVQKGESIIVSYIGCKAQTIAITGQNDITIVLQENSEMLEEVVVVGYGAMKKKDLTGSVSQINPEKMADQNPGTVQNLLRGTAGLDVGFSNDAKGGGSLQIRGQNSLYNDGGHNSPLIILDGMDFYGELSEINPADIERIDILKDASAAAVYGARAASGVIIVSTKKGKMGKPVINVSANLSTSWKGDKRNVWSAGNYMRFREDYLKAQTYGVNPETGAYEAYQTRDKNGNLTIPTGYYDHYDNIGRYGIDQSTWLGYTTNGEQSLQEIYARRLGMDQNMETLEAYLNGYSYDWQNDGFQTAFNQDYTASISGATERVNYYLSLGYLDNEGVVRGDQYKAFRANMKINGKVTDWLEIGGNINFQDRTDDAQAADWSAMQKNNPFAPKYDENGELKQYPMNSVAPKRGVNYDFDKQWQELEKGYQVFNAIFNAKVTLPLGFTYQFNISPRYQYWQDRYWEKADKPDRIAADSYVHRQWSKNFDWSLNNIITWDYTIAQKNHFVVTLVQEAEERKYWSDQITAKHILPTDALGFHNTENATKLESSFSTNDTHQSADALMARLFYSYDDRYMLTASIRRDGYSAFGLNNPHATFPSLALAWNFAKEKFCRLDWLNSGKLRLSWGKNGNRSLANEYIALADLGSGTGATMGYLGANGQVINDMKYLAFNRMANPNLQWEKTEAYNIGLDFGILNYRINGSIDFYAKKTHDMIMNKPLPGFAGFGSITTNLGQVNNTGIEISINSTNIANPNFTWTTNAVFSYNRNRIKHLFYEYGEDGKELNQTGSGWFIDRPIGQIWDYKVLGIWQVDEVEEAAKYGQRPGDPKVWNNPENDKEDGTPVYGDDDKVFQGTTVAPFFWSLTNTFTIWKDFDFGFTLYSKFGHKRTFNDYLNRINGTSEFTFCYNTLEREYWTPENPTNEFGRWEASGPANAQSVNKVYDAGFIRLNNISIGYTLPQKWTRKAMIEKCRFSASLNNVAVWAWDWKYNDPENNSFSRRTFSFGVNLTL